MRHTRQAAWLIHMACLSMLLVAAGCKEEPLRGSLDGAASDASNGVETMADVSDPIPDVPAETAPEVAPDLPPDPWTTPDSPAADDAEVPHDATPDPGPPPDVPDDVPTECQPLGQADPPGYGQPCTDACGSGMVCLVMADGSKVCQLLASGNCLPCVEDADCPTADLKCMPDAGEVDHCAAPCVTDCPPGFGCAGGFCQPTTGSCGCDESAYGDSLVCVNSNQWGECQGTTTCTPDGWTACTALPAQEICDGEDNDCDGSVDEAPVYVESGVGKTVGTACGLGACAGGQVVCAIDGSVECSTSSLAMTEVCANDLDDDCDGLTDEADVCAVWDIDGDGFSDDDELAANCDPNDAGFYPGNPYEACCPPGVPVVQCDRNCDGAVVACQACDTDFDGFCPPEDFDDTDPTIFPGAPDKCDDGIDQDGVGGDMPCPPGTDVDGDGYRPPFDCAEGNELVHPYAQELCDGFDNDCDGMVDEGDPGGGGLCDATGYYCLSGVLHCVHYPQGAIIECIGSVLAQLEKCDGVDNDCDGETDELWPELGAACDGQDPDCCTEGVAICSADGSGTTCVGETYTGSVEICNALDDDCDGSTDEYLTCCCAYDLDGDGWDTDEHYGYDCDDFDAGVFPDAPEGCCLPPATVEECDKNCDGVVTPCPAGDDDGDGFNEEMGDCDDADPAIHPGQVEVCGDCVDQDCDGADLDCAGLVDFDQDGYPATSDCDDNDPTVHPGASERCNHADDNCDGLWDEGNPTTQSGACGPMAPGCPVGVWRCRYDNQEWTSWEVCWTDSYNQPELCNGLDDNCDGLIDESFPDLGLPCDEACDPDGCANGTWTCVEGARVCLDDVPCAPPTVCVAGVGCVSP